MKSIDLSSFHLPTTIKSGIGLRQFHYNEIISQKPKVNFLEIHPENYFGGGIELYVLDTLSQSYPISFHSVSLSLCSSEKVSIEQLAKIKKLIDRFDPVYISDHASWSVFDNAHLNDLLPSSYCYKTLNSFCDNINITQDYFNRQIFVENPSTYLQFKNEMTEEEFLMNTVRRTGCRLLIDVNNIFVNSVNHRFDERKYINSINKDAIGQIHLAGHTMTSIQGIEKRIDTHNDFVCDEVWNLYEYLIQMKGNFPTLIEWDDNFPSLDDLVGEAKKSYAIMNKNECKHVR